MFISQFLRDMKSQKLRTSLAYQGLNKGRVIRFTEEDALSVKQQVPAIKDLSPEYTRYGVELKRDRNTYATLVRGVYPVYAEIRNVIPERGSRFIDAQDLDQKRRVIFLGDKVKKELFKDGEAVGKYILLNRIPFLVVGILIEKKQSSDYGERDENAAFIPATTFSAIFGPKYISNMVIKAWDPGKNKALIKQVLTVMGKKYKFNPDDTDAISYWNMMEQETLFTSIFLGFNLFLGMVGVFTLIVGGIGVSNIMNVVVEERTKEIGIKMALGAKRRYVLLQFVSEALMIAFSGGVIGIVLSLVLVQVIKALNLQGGAADFIAHPVISVQTMTVTAFLLGLIGFLAGLFPARRAASLDPVEALRYE